MSNSPCGEIQLLDLVNMNIDSHLSGDNVHVARDHDGYLIGHLHGASCDSQYRENSALSALSTIRSIQNGESLKYYCDSRNLYVGTKAISVETKIGEELVASIERSASLAGLNFLHMGMKDSNLFETYYPVLVTRTSFEIVCEVFHREQGNKILKKFVEEATVDEDGALDKPWSVFPQGTKASEILTWVRSKYSLPEDGGIGESKIETTLGSNIV